MAKWIYLLEGARRELDEVKGPVPRSVLVDLIRTGRLSGDVIVAPTATFDANGLPAYMWPEMIQGLSADLPMLCRVWLRGAEPPSFPERDLWAYHTADDLVRTRAATGWRLVCALVDDAPNENMVQYVGASLLEPFIEHHRDYHARVVFRAKRDDKFRRCLRSCYDSYLTKEMQELVRG